MRAKVIQFFLWGKGVLLHSMVTDNWFEDWFEEWWIWKVFTLVLVSQRESSRERQGNVLGQKKGYLSQVNPCTGFTNKGTGFTTKGTGFTTKGTWFTTKGIGFTTKRKWFTTKGTGFTTI